MNFIQLTTFRSVMTSASLSDAAVKLGRTQPAVSAAIKGLEEQLGLPLFERRGRKLIPVPEAQYLLAEAETILSQMSRVEQTMRSLSGGQAGTLKVAAMPGPVSMLFPQFIAANLTDTTDTSVSIQAQTSGQIAELARAQAVDFGFADAPENVEQEPLYQAEIISADCMVALPATHPLTAKGHIHIAQLDGVPMGTLPTSHPQTISVQAAFNAGEARLHQTVETQTFLPVLHFVAAGQCCTIIDPLSVYMVRGPKAMLDGVEIRPMAVPVRYEYALFSPRYRPVSVVAQNLRDAWRTEVMTLLNQLKSQPRLA